MTVESTCSYAKMELLSSSSFDIPKKKRFRCNTRLFQTACELLYPMISSFHNKDAIVIVHRAIEIQFFFLLLIQNGVSFLLQYAHLIYNTGKASSRSCKCISALINNYVDDVMRFYDVSELRQHL